MKKYILLLFFLFAAPLTVKAQQISIPKFTGISLRENENLSSGEFLARFSPESLYYNSIDNQSIIKNTT